MKPSSKFTYVLRALVDLALHEKSGPVTVATIARRQGIPGRYLEQLFNRLRRNGLVIAERGPRGGYRLGRPASEILVSTIFESVEPRRPSAAKEMAASDPGRRVWQQVEQAVATTLQATRLEELVAQARRSQPALVNHRFTFHI